MNRKKIIFKNISLGVLYKILNMGIVFTTIPILLNYLEKEQYGIWVTIFSVVNVVFFVDAGIGNGLKTKLTEALSLQNRTLAKTYISTAYITIFVISIIVFGIGTLLISSLDMQVLFNTKVLTKTELEKILYITLFLITISFVLNLYKSFYFASQQAAKVELAMLFYQISVLLLITILLNFFTRDLLLVALVYGFSNIFVGVFFTFVFFKKNIDLSPKLTFFKKNRVKDLMGLSLAFFVIQLCMIVIFTTDNLIITKLLGPKEVTNYDIVYKLFQVLITFTVLLQEPFWALYTDAFQRKDFKWIKKTIYRLNKIFIVFILLVLLMFLATEKVIEIWIQRDINITNNLILYISLFVIIRVYGAIYMIFLNAIGKVKIQMWLYVFGAILNIPLSIYLVKQFNLGSSGVIIGSIFSILSLSIILPIQSFKILKKNEFD